jgi:AcrR family transcriptional regulator
MSPRAGLTTGRVVEAAGELADREGLAELTLARVAAGLGVRTPSLYNHIDGLDDLRRHLTLRGLAELNHRLQRAAVGTASGDAVRAIAVAFRAFALEHPGLYAATVPSTEVEDAAVRQAGSAVVATVVAALSGYGLGETGQIHAARTLRSAVHGFVALELSGGFALAVETGETFDWMVELISSGLSARTPE